MIRILLADDHKLVRQGIKSLLEEESDFEIIGEARDGHEAVDLAQRLSPDILVTDLKMPGMDGLQVTRYLREIIPNTCIIMLTMVNDEVYVTEALKAGVHGYVVKDSSIDELTAAIRTVRNGERYISKRINGNSQF